MSGRKEPTNSGMTASSNSALAAVSSTSSMRRGPVKKSPIWGFFTPRKCEPKGSGKKKYTEEAVCKECPFTVLGSFTSNMKNHLETRHPSSYQTYLEREKQHLAEEEKKKKTSDDSSPSSHQNILHPTITIKRKKNPFPRGSPQQVGLKEKVGKWVGCSNTAASTIQNEDFVELIEFCNPRMADTLPTSHNTVIAWAIEFSCKVETLVKALIKESRKVVITCDIWSQTGLHYSYIGVNAYFYCTRSKRVEVAALACQLFMRPHTGVRIREVLLEILKKYGIEEKDVPRFRTDRGSNIINGLNPFTIQRTVRSARDEEEEMIDFEIVFESGATTAEESRTEESEDDDLFAGFDLEDLDMDHQLDEEFDQFQNQEMEEMQAFPKRLSCIDHMLNNLCSNVIDKTDSPVHSIKKSVLSLLANFGRSCNANELLKRVCGKKLVKVANTRWHYFYYVCKRLLECKDGIIEVCREQDWPITFTWTQISVVVKLLHPFAAASVYLEADQYPTSSAVVPALLTLEEHIMDEAKVFSSLTGLSEKLLPAFRKMFGSILDPKDPKFDETHLICSMLDPENSACLSEMLFEEGKRRLATFILSETADWNTTTTARSSPDSQAATSITDNADDVISLPSAPESRMDEMHEPDIARSATAETRPPSPTPEPAQPSLKKRRRLVNEQTSSSTVSDREKSLLQARLKEEITNYLSILTEGAFERDVTALGFWHSRAALFPYFAPIALTYLTIPGTSASSERMFSLSGASSKGLFANTGPVLLEAKTLCKFNRKFLRLAL